jgi:uncharacterized LabA/DUF88 family protein
MGEAKRRVVCFVDGFNVFHALDACIAYHRYKWLDYAALARSFITGREEIVQVRYYTALATWNPGKVEKHQAFIRAQRSRGVEVVYGVFRRTTRTCRVCGQGYSTYEEKLTDVNLAIDLLRLAHLDRYDKALLVTGDSDIAPAIEAVKQTFPHKQVAVVIPVSRRAEHLKQVADSFHKMKVHHLERSQFPDEVTLPDGSVVRRPATWQ